jgi:ribosomal protein S18 acetylase RimI-like enzyme
MKRNKELKERFYNELLNKTRMTFVYTKDEEYIREISVVFNKNDEDYSIPGMRLYISRIIVKKDCRGKGYGKKLMNFIIEYAKREGYEELSLGVNLDNYIALKLYVELGFNKIQYIGEDSDGKYVKLIKRL